MAYSADLAKVRGARVLLIIGAVGAILALARAISNLAMELGAEPLLSPGLVDLLLSGAYLGGFIGMALGLFGLGNLYGSKLAAWAGLARLVLLADIYLIGLTQEPIIGVLTTIAIVGLDVGVMVVLFRQARVRWVWLGVAIALPILAIVGYVVPSFVAGSALSVLRGVLWVGIFGVHGAFAFLAYKQLVGLYTEALAYSLAQAAAEDAAVTGGGYPQDLAPSPTRARTLATYDVEYKLIEHAILSIGSQPESRGADIAPGEPGYATWIYDGHRISYEVDPMTRLRKIEVTGGHDPERVVSALVCDAYLPSLEGYRVSGLLESQQPGELLYAIAAAEHIGINGKERFYVDHLARLASHPDPNVAAAASRALQTIDDNAAAA